ncbi:DBH-like monooxygenase protein 1 [Physella acuta]|uniref:DBH-like monooxygenase protein 1 n=1 Tax=Physella acuta TaxID=109671 RepID=UPI0027DC7149|nr:DBH-like monooxygenase protein 1 [Physella acuta]XP_059144069.1 DBH-like monooxygenase protein 1 [Physella acuta]
MFYTVVVLSIILGHVTETCSLPVNNEYLDAGNLTYHETLDENYQLYWNFNSSHIIFKTVVKTNGFIGFGISPNGGMSNADVVIGWVKDGVPHFADRHAQGHVMPAVDTQQDWHLVEAVEVGETTSLVFIRELNTCDPQDLPITNSTTRIIFSYHPSDPAGDDSIQYHGSHRRGTKSVLLLTPPASVKDRDPLPDDVISFEFLNHNVSVPARDTYYHCVAWKLPKLTEKHHLIRYEPVIQQGHEKLLHHMILYYCSSGFDDTHVGSSYDCYQQPPPAFTSCEHIFMAWAIGGKAFDYPNHLGHSLGTPQDPGYFRMETHYNNPDLRDDFVDNSGFRFFLTKHLRQFDVGILESGLAVDYTQIIPPYADSFISRGYCQSDCLGQVLADDDIHVFASGLHAHLLGNKVRARHFRKGVELPPLSEDNTYDFNYQEMRLFPQEVTLKNGDHLIVECDYDSRSRQALTTGGLPATSEMCIVFLLYYPRTSLSRCLTSTMYKISDDQSPQTMFDLAQTMDWTNPTVRANFQRTTDEADIRSYCWMDNNPSLFTIKDSPKPNITQVFQPPRQCQN